MQFCECGLYGSYIGEAAEGCVGRFVKVEGLKKNITIVNTRPVLE